LHTRASHQQKLEAGKMLAPAGLNGAKNSVRSWADGTSARHARALALSYGEGEIAGGEIERRAVDLRLNDVRLRLYLLAPNVVRVRAVKGSSDFSKNQSFVVEPNAFASVMGMDTASSDSSASSGFAMKDGAKEIELTNPKSQITVRIVKNPLQLIFQDKAGKVISEDLIDRPLQLNSKGFQVWKSSPIDEHYFGLGDKTGPLDRRDQAFTFWNTDAFLFQESTDPIYKSFPFMLAMRNGAAHGIFLNNTYRSFFDFNKSVRNAYSFGAEDGELDYYFFYGPDPKKVIEDYTRLVGRMPLPPLFSLGYQQSRGSYFPEARVMQIARELRQRRIPTDVIYFDGDYKQDAHPFTVNRSYFPDFGRVISNLSQLGFKSIISLDPYLAKAPGEEPYEQGIASGYFVTNPDGKPFVGQVWPGEVVFPDFTRAAVRKWWGGLHERFTKIGVRGIWDDMNEPALFKTPEKTLPLDTVHSFEGRKTDHREAHNIYGMQNTRATFEGLMNLRPNQRPFILTRSGFSGSQRYAATWTGDNTSTWNHMRLSVPQLLNLGLSGLTFAGSDIGGFNGFSGGPTPDLLTRWMQLGAFNPLFRNHSDGVTREREPWVDGPEHEAIRKRFIEERYKLLPYIYTCMEDASRTGVPLMRPMFLEFPSDSSVITNAEQYMFGPSLLVAPRLWDIHGQYVVRLPAGNWYDYWTGKKVKGDQTLSVDPPISTAPIYVRGSSIVPMQSVVQHVEEAPEGPLELRVYLSGDATEKADQEFYFDDGDTFDYKAGKFLKLKVSVSKAGANDLNVKVSSSGDYALKQKQVRIVVFGLAKPAQSVSFDGSAISGWKFEIENESLSLPPTDFIAGKTQDIQIALKN
ncbi:MAG: glycoside hydrolase family 31 protein, partial [Candidatus Obscuribacterales bacterium]|nr:glycoside hydrolase family 31 protein [Candidatus Obscuribacterales bacterium]